MVHDIKLEHLVPHRLRAAVSVHLQDSSTLIWKLVSYTNRKGFTLVDCLKLLHSPSRVNTT